MKIYIVLAGSGGILDQREVSIMPHDHGEDEYSEAIGTCLHDLLADARGWNLKVGDSITIVEEE